MPKQPIDPKTLDQWHLLQVAERLDLETVIDFIAEQMTVHAIFGDVITEQAIERKQTELDDRDNEREWRANR